MTEQAELTRRRTIYIRDEEQEIWADAVALASLLDEPLSAVIAAALKEYKPLVVLRGVRAGVTA